MHQRSSISVIDRWEGGQWATCTYKWEQPWQALLCTFTGLQNRLLAVSSGTASQNYHHEGGHVSIDPYHPTCSCSGLSTWLALACSSSLTVAGSASASVALVLARRVVDLAGLLQGHGISLITNPERIPAVGLKEREREKETCQASSLVQDMDLWPGWDEGHWLTDSGGAWHGGSPAELMAEWRWPSCLRIHMSCVS